MCAVRGTKLYGLRIKKKSQIMNTGGPDKILREYNFQEKFIQIFWNFNKFLKKYSTYNYF